MKTKIFRFDNVLMRGIMMGALLLYLLACVCVPAFANGPEEDYIPDDTDGTEMQVMQAAQLELQLGEDWADAEFELTTDAGEYPGTVPVSADGVLRMEVGGSETYVLKLIETPAVPLAEVTPEPTSEPTPEPTEEPIVEEPAEEVPEEDESPDKEAEEESNGIPIVPVIVFGVGLLIAAGVLVGMRVLSKRRGREDYDDDGENDG